MVNGQDLHVKPGSSAAPLVAKAAGWYLLALTMAEPGAPISLQLQLPGAGAPGRMADMWQMGYGKFVPGLGAAQALAPTASQGLLLHYRWSGPWAAALQGRGGCGVWG
jgi:hypothetical protein